jgi:transposase
VRRLDRQVKTASQAIGTAVGEHGTTLTEGFGVGPVLAAKLLGHTGDITRFPSRDHFASDTGTDPIEAFSGDVRRHRLNQAGNRQLNTALHLIAVCQIRDPSPGRPTTGASWSKPRPPRKPAAASTGALEPINRYQHDKHQPGQHSAACQQIVSRLSADHFS